MFIHPFRVRRKWSREKLLLIDYYKDKGIDVTVDRVEDVAGAFAIYSVREK